MGGRAFDKVCSLCVLRTSTPISHSMTQTLCSESFYLTRNQQVIAMGVSLTRRFVSVLHCSSAIISSATGSCRLCAACLSSNAVDAEKPLVHLSTHFLRPQWLSS